MNTVSTRATVEPRRDRRAAPRIDAVALFLLVVTVHWIEHLVQALQIYLLDLPPARALGALGLVLPGLVQSEWLHLGFNLGVLAGIVVLLGRFRGRARAWWNLALGVQAWHLFEHGLLFLQAQTGTPFFGADMPVSVLQLLVPRVELHLAYNAAVTSLLLVAALARPSVSERQAA